MKKIITILLVGFALFAQAQQYDSQVIPMCDGTTNFMRVVITSTRVGKQDFYLETDKLLNGSNHTPSGNEVAGFCDNGISAKDLRTYVRVPMCDNDNGNLTRFYRILRLDSLGQVTVQDVDLAGGNYTIAGNLIENCCIVDYTSANGYKLMDTPEIWPTPVDATSVSITVDTVADPNNPPTITIAGNVGDLLEGYSISYPGHPYVTPMIISVNTNDVVLVTYQTRTY